MKYFILTCVMFLSTMAYAEETTHILPFFIPTQTVEMIPAQHMGPVYPTWPHHNIAPPHYGYSHYDFHGHPYVPRATPRYVPAPPPYYTPWHTSPYKNRFMFQFHFRVSPRPRVRR